MLQAGLSLPVAAQESQWTGSADTSWTNGANWSPAGVPANDVAIAPTSSGGNMPVIDGTDETLAGHLFTGNSSATTGSLTIQNGGTLSFGGGQFTVGGGDADVTVSGAGSQLTAQSSGYGLIVGNADGGNTGMATFHVLDGAKVSGFKATYFGHSNDGHAVISGTGSSLSITDTSAPLQLVVGFHASGTLDIKDGATVTTPQINVGWYSSGTSGTINIDGSGSQLTVSGDGGFSPMRMADQGSATLSITNGGALHVIDAERLPIGNSGGTATITVDGSGSTFNTDGGINFNAGTFTLSNGGTVTSGDETSVGGSSATLIIGAAASAAAVAPGTLNAPSADVDGTLVFNHTGTNYIFAPSISGVQASIIRHVAGTTVLTGHNQDFPGTTTISGGTLHLGNGGTSTILGGDITNNSALVFNKSNRQTLSGVISGTGTVTQAGSGTIELSGTNTYTGGTFLNNGTLSVSSNANLGDTTSALAFNGGTLQVTGTSYSSTSRTMNWGSAGGGFDIGNAGLEFDVTQAITGSGPLSKLGDGTLALSGDSSSFSGETSVTAGLLSVNGQLGGTVDVASGGALGGRGTIGGDITIAGNATLQGRENQTLTINGDLTLNDTSKVKVRLGAAETAGLFDVGGDLTLDGTLNITDMGSFGPGTYRLFDYSGNLTDNTLTIGTTPTGSTSGYQVDTTTNNQVNLISSAGVTLNYWDGGATGNAGNGTVDGGDGTWNLANTDWTEQDGSVNGPWDNGHYAIFQGTAGTVTVDDTGGDVGATGMQFHVDGYTVTGDSITVSRNDSKIRVGDGTPAGRNMTATIASKLTGAGGLDKTDYGTLILTADNSYTGGTTVSDGTLQIGNGGTSGSIAGDVTNNGTLVFKRSDSYTLANAISGSGRVEQAGSGALALTGASTYTGGTTISAGTLQIGNGGTSGSIQGDVDNSGTLAFKRSDSHTFAGDISGSGTVEQAGSGTTVLTGNNTHTGGTSVSTGTLQIGDSGTTGSITGDVDNKGTLLFNRSDSYTFQGAISGNGNMEQIGSGTTVLTGKSTYTGGTTISAGTLQLGDGGSSGGITGDVTANGTLAVNRSNDYNFTGVLSGSGALRQIGSGTLYIASTSDGFTGTTTVADGALVMIDGRLSGTVTATGGSLGGNGTLTGDVTIASGGTLSGNEGEQLIIGGDLVLDQNATTDVTLGSVEDSGLFDVTGDLTLGGTLNINDMGGFGAGTYRLFDYGGSLTDNGMTIGTIPSGIVPSELELDTGTANQVNLINEGGVELIYWDGDGNAGDGTIDGGDGTWNLANSDWTDKAADQNGAWQDDHFAIFQGTAGTVTVDDGGGNIAVAGMQFAVDGYTVTSDAITLNKTETIIRTGAGSRGGDVTATIAAELAGDGGLKKTDYGTLVLTADNSYTGGTIISHGTLQLGDGGTTGSLKGDIANQGTLAVNRSNSITFDGVISGSGKLVQMGTGTTTLTGTNTYTGGTTISAGTLQLGAGGTAGSLKGNIVNKGTLAFNRSDALTLSGAISGSGSVEQIGTGTTVLNGENSYTGATTIKAGTLKAGAEKAFSARSQYSVRKGAGLDLDGYDQTVASLDNAGGVRLGGNPGNTLTVSGNYKSAGGTVHLDSALAGDNSVTDRLHVKGSTSGKTTLAVTNIGGKGALTDKGIKVVDIDGASNGGFTLQGHYTFKGDPAVVAGAYAYRLYKGTPDSNDGDWYLRSQLEKGQPNPPPPPPPPHYQPGTPVYESYAQTLGLLNRVGTMRQRVGQRQWLRPAGAEADGETMDNGVWGRIGARHGTYNPRKATTNMDYDATLWTMQAGIDARLANTGAGRLVGGLFGRYATASTDTKSPHGNGGIDSKGYGAGATLTWLTDGFYADAQGQATWSDSDLYSLTADRTLARDGKGFGYAASLETGWKLPITADWALTPQAQATYSDISFDAFTDSFGARVNDDTGDSLRARAGLAADYQNRWTDAQGRAASADLYGIANVYYETMDGLTVDVSGTSFTTANHRLWTGIGVGGAINWANGLYAIHADLSADTAVEDFGKSYTLSANLGLRIKW